MSGQLAVVLALVVRQARELRRQAVAVLGTVLAPTIFFVGLSGVFGRAHQLGIYPGGSFRSFIIPVGLLQGAGFAGAAAGVNLARDMESGWFDRLLVAPVRRPVLLAGVAGSAALRSLLPACVLLAVGLSLGVRWPGIAGLGLALALVMGMAAAAACYSAVVALRFRSQQAATLMQIATLSLILLAPAYAPESALQSWLREIAHVNPVARILLGVRQGFVGGLTWERTWPALVVVGALLAAFGALAVRALRHWGD